MLPLHAHTGCAETVACLGQKLHKLRAVQLRVDHDLLPGLYIGADLGNETGVFLEC